MTFRRICAVLSCTLPLTVGLFSFSTPVSANECVASGSTIKEAQTRYAMQCDSKRKDCDFIDGLWYCANINITASSAIFNVPDLPAPPASPINDVTNADLQTDTNVVQPATGTCVDYDGDGWGWNGVSSCRVTTDDTTAGNNAGFGISPVVSNGSANCVDYDGDGWGWNGVSSCQINTNDRSSIEPAGNTGIASVVLDVPADCVDEDGDGWGWNGISSCRVVASDSNRNDPVAVNTSTSGLHSAVPDNCSRLNSGNHHITELVTDVILTAGQSNAAGGDTQFQPERFSQDRINSRVLVWTERNRWEVADPRTQTWHNGTYPGGKGLQYNHPAFQIGRAVADQDECRVVGLIATAAPGKPIDHWLQNRENHYTEITNKVTMAINALPGRYQIDMVWWMQGEADNDQIISRYFSKLNSLINRFRSESWFSTDGYFLANETMVFPFANEAIRMLGNDGDRFTNFSRGEHSLADPFPNVSNDPAGVHFNEVALRKIGNLVADKYVHEFLQSRPR